MAPVVPTEGLYVLLLLPALLCSHCLQGTGGRGTKMPRPKSLGILFVRLMVLEEVDFRRQ